MRSTTRRALVQGLIAGLVAYGSVVVFFVLVNFGLGRSPFHTPAVLGAALLGRAAGGSEIPVAGYVIAYNGVHMGASLLLGLLAAWLVHEAEDHHVLWFVSYFLLLSAFLSVLVGLGVAGVEVAGVMSWTAVIAGTTVAAVSMGLYLWRTHPRLAGELIAELDA